jgi:hypothetical protein
MAVAAGAPNHRNIGLTAAIYTMEKFSVAGEREGLAQAIALQKVSNGVKNIISTDAFGSIGGNPADLVARLPGVNTTGFEGDTRYVQIRGLSQNLGTVTMDGNRVADAAFAGSGRSYSFQMVSSDSFERIEVVKSPTPDMDGDSIAGAVNMVSKSAFDSSPQRGCFDPSNAVAQQLLRRPLGAAPLFRQGRVACSDGHMLRVRVVRCSLGILYVSFDLPLECPFGLKHFVVNPRCSRSSTCATASGSRTSTLCTAPYGSGPSEQRGW